MASADPESILKSYRTAREVEIYKEYDATEAHLHAAITDPKYYQAKLAEHTAFIKALINNPVNTYQELRRNPKRNQAIEGVVLKLLEEIFKIKERAEREFRMRAKSLDSQQGHSTLVTSKYLKHDINQFNAMYQQVIIRVSQIFFKQRFYLDYRPTIETIVDMLTFIDVMCRANSDTCSGAANPYFHSRRYLYYLKYMLDQYNDGHIVIPTLEAIGATDFIKIRCVPVYLIGCHPTSDFADEYWNTPLEFFAHDVQHARRQLYYTERELYRNWTDKSAVFSKRFAKNANSRSPFNIFNTGHEPGVLSEWSNFTAEMAAFTNNHLKPLLLLPKDGYTAPLNEFGIAYNDKLERGLRAMRKMILFEALHEAALVPLPDVIIKCILMPTHKTPIERMEHDASASEHAYYGIVNKEYNDPTTLSNVLYKIQGTFFDRKEDRLEFVVPVAYRTSSIVALAALQILYVLGQIFKGQYAPLIKIDGVGIDEVDKLYNKLLVLTLCRENRLQSTTAQAVEGTMEKYNPKHYLNKLDVGGKHSDVLRTVFDTSSYTIKDVLDKEGNLILEKFKAVPTTRTTIYNDPALGYMEEINEYGKTVGVNEEVNFYGPRLGDQLSKVGIFGGSFDPPHNSHKLRLQKLYNATSLQKLVVSVVANDPARKPDLAPQEERVKWITMVVKEILEENDDPNLASFIANPILDWTKPIVINESKFQIEVGSKNLGQTIDDIRGEYGTYEVIAIYGSDYKILKHAAEWTYKEGGLINTPMNHFYAPRNYRKEPGQPEDNKDKIAKKWHSANDTEIFYQGVTQIQFQRPSCGIGCTSSTNVRFNALNFIIDNPTAISEAALVAEEGVYAKDMAAAKAARELAAKAGEIALAASEEGATTDLKKLAAGLDMSIPVLVAYIRFLTLPGKSGRSKVDNLRQILGFIERFSSENADWHKSIMNLIEEETTLQKKFLKAKESNNQTKMHENELTQLASDSEMSVGLLLSTINYFSNKKKLLEVSGEAASPKKEGGAKKRLTVKRSRNKRKTVKVGVKSKNKTRR